MIYTADDVKFDQLSPTEFERLCFELLLKYGFTEVSWRQGGADNGRDIEAYLNFPNQIVEKKTKWFFECKRYTGRGVPPEHLNSKIAWADSERPDFLVMLISSYITTPARRWLDGIRDQKQYDIVVIEGEELKNKLLQFPDLIECFFAADRYEQLLIDVKKHWRQYKIDPSYESLKEITGNIDPAKLDLNDLGFILMSFHKNYSHFESRNDYYGDFTDEILEPLFTRLAELSSNNNLELFDKYRKDFSYLGGLGCFDDAEAEEKSDRLFQYYTLHLNAKQSKDKWSIGHYLFLRTEQGSAFELFSVDNSDFLTASKYYRGYKPDILHELAIDISIEFGKKILEYGPRLLKEPDD